MNRLGLLSRRLDTRSMEHILRRVYTILIRYGIGRRLFSRTLWDFIGLVRGYGITPTLPVTASVVGRHPNLFQQVQESGVELAVHGYRHVDYTQLPLEELRQDLRCAVEVFRTHGIRFSGYRYPYLRRDTERVDLLGEMGFEWDSSEVVSWHGLEASQFDKREWDAYERILATYEAADADAVRVLPRMSGGLVEVPVSVPDDDILVERLRLDDDGTMVKVWAGMVRRVRERRELLVLQVHPERFEWYRRALESTLRLAREGKDVWAASLGEIARWWREREDFGFEIEKISDGRYRVVARCTDRATILLKKGLTRGSGSGLWGSAVTVDARTFEVESPVKPVIGVDPETPTAVVRFLKEEGFAHTVAEKEGNCSFFLRHRGFFGENEKRRILESVEEIRFPLVRFWRWPEGARYSLAVTGDIDGVDLLDFWGRFYG